MEKTIQVKAKVSHCKSKLTSKLLVAYSEGMLSVSREAKSHVIGHVISVEVFLKKYANNFF